MATYTDIAQVALDAYRGRTAKYSTEQSLDSLRQALVEANNGSTTLDIRAIRDGKCPGLFTLIETILSVTVAEGLQNDDFFNNFVEFVNVGAGDKNLFEIEDSDLFTVSKAADGTQGIRRQRIGGVTTTSIPTVLHTVKIYEELSRVLAGEVDFNKFINKVAESVAKELLDEIYSVFSGLTSGQLGGATYCVDVAGAYSEDAVLDMIGHLEAATGKTVTIVGTKKALRKLVPAIQGGDSKNDLYHLGYYGNFYGTETWALPQRHRTGTNTFIFSDNELWLVAGDPKFIKVVYEGQPYIIMGQPNNNGDLTQEYQYNDKYGVGVVITGKTQGIARYKFT